MLIKHKVPESKAISGAVFEKTVYPNQSKGKSDSLPGQFGQKSYQIC